MRLVLLGRQVLEVTWDPKVSRDLEAIRVHLDPKETKETLGRLDLLDHLVLQVQWEVLDSLDLLAQRVIQELLEIKVSKIVFHSFTMEIYIAPLQGYYSELRSALNPCRLHD